VCLDPADSTADAAIQRADAAMYMVKKARRGA
jgi:GGDEF domain-containing protein